MMDWRIIEDRRVQAEAERQRLEDVLDDLVMPLDTQELLGVETWEARAVQLEAEVERLRDGLFACAREAGEDVSDGAPPTSPDIVDWAVRAVNEGRRDAEEGDERLEKERDQLRDAIREHRGAERLCQDPEDFDLRLWAAVPGLTEETT